VLSENRSGELADIQPSIHPLTILSTNHPSHPHPIPITLFITYYPVLWCFLEQRGGRPGGPCICVCVHDLHMGNDTTHYHHHLTQLAEGGVHWVRHLIHDLLGNRDMVITNGRHLTHGTALSDGTACTRRYAIVQYSIASIGLL